MAIAELTLIPIGTDNTSVSTYIAKALDATKSFPNVNVSLNPMGTILEGPIEELFTCIKAMEETVFESGANRCYMVIKLDDRRDKSASMEQKIASVEAKRQS